MNKHYWLALCVAPAFLIGCGDKQPTYSEKVSEQWISPAYQQLADSTREFSQQTLSTCSDKVLTDDEWVQLQAGWKKGMAAWQQAQLIHFGPIEQDNQRWLYQFWPDMHNNIRRKVQPLIDAQEPIDSAKLKTAGVVARGFSALEYALFDVQKTAENSAGLCAYLTVATDDMQQTSEGLLRSWQKGAQYRHQFDQPNEKNPVFPNAKDTQAAMLDAIVSQLEVIRNDKLAGPLGLKTARSRPNVYLTESWRSKTSLQWLEVNLQGLKAVLLDHHYGLVQQIEDDAVRVKMAKELDLQMQQIDVALTALNNTSFEDALASDIEKLQTLHYAWQVLLQTVKNNLPKALGVTLGFNANDGD